MSKVRVVIEDYYAFIFNADSEEILNEEILKLNEKGFKFMDSHKVDYGYAYSYDAKLRKIPDFDKMKKSRHASIDYIVEIREAVNRGDIKLYFKNGYIYMETENGESVILNYGNLEDSVE